MTVLGPRRHRAELLDRPDQDRAALERSLAHVSAVNRWLGGDRALRLHLSDALEGADGPARVVDVGTGDAGLLRRLARDPPTGAVRLVGVDVHPRIARIAHDRSRGRPGIQIVQADGLRLPFPDDAFDAAVCTLTLHHFRDPAAADLLAEMARVARRRVVVNDLERSLANYLGARVLARTVWRRSSITRNDGPLSVLRSFTPGELERVGRRAGLLDVRVRRRFPFRLILDARPPTGRVRREAAGA